MANSSPVFRTTVTSLSGARYSSFTAIKKLFSITFRLKMKKNERLVTDIYNSYSDMGQHRV